MTFSSADWQFKYAILAGWQSNIAYVLEIIKLFNSQLGGIFMLDVMCTPWWDVSHVSWNMFYVSWRCKLCQLGDVSYANCEMWVMPSVRYELCHLWDVSYASCEIWVMSARNVSYASCDMWVMPTVRYASCEMWVIPAVRCELCQLAYVNNVSWEMLNNINYCRWELQYIWKYSHLLNFV